MAAIEISRDHTLGADEATRRIQTIEPDLQSKYGVKLSWRSGGADLKGKGVSGQVKLTEDHLRLSLDLGLLLRPMAGKIKAAIERKLDAALNGDG